MTEILPSVVTETNSLPRKRHYVMTLELSLVEIFPYLTWLCQTARQKKAQGPVQETGRDLV